MAILAPTGAAVAVAAFAAVAAVDAAVAAALTALAAVLLLSERSSGVSQSARISMQIKLRNIETYKIACLRF